MSSSLGRFAMGTRGRSHRAQAITGLVLLTAALLAGSTAAHAAPGQPARQTCDRGEFCVWEAEDYQGRIERLDLTNANPNECVSLPEGFHGRSFVNRTSRAVTAYQGRDCATEGDFSTYPGEGTYVPHAPYLVRGIQFWD